MVELARMLSGHDQSESAREHARAASRRSRSAAGALKPAANRREKHEESAGKSAERRHLFALKTIKGAEVRERASESCRYSPCR